ncbi:hypothetical protein [Solirhodobacter olei]|uniref:hypothetical protein n=1 Tax=Solirhodobacter olei TaxID=2493082 RepID=UPI000FD6BD71|nr:hypothetical protein [Solirhodobacter olei]
MKPSFALNLSHDGIGLLHRTPNGWSSVGEVALDSADLGKAMGFLRSTALALEPRGLVTKVILPASQVLYTTVTAPGPTTPQRRNQISRALEGLTPYTAAELVFDWSGPGPELKVAVVARETLAEAEHFATEHRFHPVCFVAMPDPEQFDGEPFFGETKGASAFLSGETLERDTAPVRITATAPKPAPAAQEAPEPARAAPKDARDDAAPVDEARVDAALGDIAVTDPALPDPEAPPATRPASPAPVAEFADAPGQPAFSTRRSAEEAALAAPVGTDQPARLRFLPEAFQHAAEGLTAAPPAAEAPAPKPAGRKPPKPRRGRAGKSRARSGSSTGEVIPAPPPLRPPSTEEEAMTLFGARQREPDRRRLPLTVLVLAAVLLIALGAAYALWAVLEPQHAALDRPAVNQTAAIAPAGPARVPASTAAPSAPSGETTPAPGAAAALSPAPHPATDTVTAAAAQTAAPTTPRAPGPDATAPAPRAETGPAGSAPQLAALPLAPASHAAAPAAPGRGVPTLRPIAVTDVKGSVTPDAPDTASDIILAAIDPAVAGQLQPGLPAPTAFATDSPPGSTPAADTTAAIDSTAVAHSLATADSAPTPPAPGGLGAIRPMPRPANIPAEATPATPAAPKVSPLAVATSIRPARRPNDISRSVNAAVASALAPAAKPAAASPPEPKKRALMIPSNPSVSQEATIKRAMRLNRINLLGVFGTTADRTALVRLSNGSVKRVKVGDRLDGGKVAAIGDDNLYYVRSGQNIQLVIPSG